MSRGIAIRIVGVGASITFLAACASGGMESNSEVEQGVDPIRDACSEALRVANSEPTLPVLTQCEVQTDGSDRIFVLQFADPSEDRIALDQGTNIDTIFNQPLNALREVWGTAAQDDGIDKYIVAFQDPCQTVWELSPELVNDFVEGNTDSDYVTNTMIISAFLC